MSTQEIRRKFLKYFKERQHAIVASSPVVPHDDPSLLFINAGMNQFKDVFLGKSAREYTRAATSQKCIRVGGKHNDLENVGHTRRHLTFFEMLGNFSFGDYFKSEAIKFSWEVSTEVFGFDPDRIWPTVFRNDDEAFELWTQYVPAERITRFGEKENFWAMGDTGPCGPCSELLFDRGAAYGAARNPLEDSTGERFLEFWNLVFMQSNRAADGTLNPLPKPSIDTGAGLERVMSLQMNVPNVFQTDLLRSLIAQVEQVTGIAYNFEEQARAPAFHVIADHLRCLAFAIADGVQPSNVDRGYVLRKVLRRAVRYGRTLGMEEPFLAKILPRLVADMGPDYKELEKGQTLIAEILTREEEAFIRTLRRGGNILNLIVEDAKAHGNQISGDDAFKLKDTYGLPFEEVLLIAKDAALTIDEERYQQLEQEAKQRSRSVHKSTQQIASENLFENYALQHGAVQFSGYDRESVAAQVTALIVAGTPVDEMKEGEEGLVVLDKTPFYAEMGGQVGDSGILQGNGQVFEAIDCQSPYKGVIAHVGTLKQGNLRVGNTVNATIDLVKRQKIANNHTATHLLHWALHLVLGEHIKQTGSVVDPQRLRFDFSHHKPLTDQEVRRIEDLVNDKIRSNLAVNCYELPYEEAQKRHDIKQFFGEKYGVFVRVIDIDFSKELCGGTHTRALGNIGLFRIAKESSIAAGTRRIEAVTGEEAEAFSRISEDLLQKLATMLKTQPQKLEERIEKLLESNKQLSEEVKRAKKEQMKNLVANLLEKAIALYGIPLVAAEVVLSVEELRTCAEDIAAKLPSGVIVLASAVAADKCHFLVRVSDDLVAKKITADALVKAIAPIIEGSGGGKGNSAQAGGKASHKIVEALEKVQQLLCSHD